MPGVSDRLISVKTEDLTIGMYVQDVGRSWFRHPWTSKSRLITTQKEIEQLKSYGISEVMVDPARGSDAPAKPTPPQGVLFRPETGKRQPPAKPVSEKILALERDIPQARQTYQEALAETKSVLNEALAGRVVRTDKIEQSVGNMVTGVMANKDAYLAVYKLKSFDDYLYTHSLNVAVLAICLGSHLGLSKDLLHEIGVGAMMHDLGKTGVPPHILHKKGRLTNDEYKSMKVHPVLSAKLIERSGQFSSLTLAVARHHHERIDGTGYPDGLRGDQIEPHVVITALADVYDAVTSDRVYHKARTPHEAMKIIFSEKDRQFAPKWVDHFIQCVGVYPAGTMIELSNGQMGVVHMANREELLRPAVRLITDERGHYLHGRNIIELSSPEHAGVEITQVLDPGILQDTMQRKRNASS